MGGRHCHQAHDGDILVLAAGRGPMGYAALRPHHRPSPWELFHPRERHRAASGEGRVGVGGGSVLEGGGHGTAPRAVGSAPHCWSSGSIRAPPSDIGFGFGFGWCCVQLELDSMTREEQLGCSVILQFFCPAKRAPWAVTAGAVLLLSQALQRKRAAM